MNLSIRNIINKIFRSGGQQKYVISRKEILEDLKNYGIYKISDDPYPGNSFFYVRTEQFSDQQFKQGVIDLMLLMGQEYADSAESTTYENLTVTYGNFTNT
jgi:hypothetical protein